MDAKPDNGSMLAGEASNHRKMLAAPALKILADPDNSEKSLKVLMSVMERCCREQSNQGVFIGTSNDVSEREIGYCFTRWFLGRFTMIFGRKSLQKIHESFVDLYIKILNLFCTREPHHFVLLVSDYITLQNKLVSTSHDYCKGQIKEKSPIKLNVFMSQTVKLSPNLELVLEGLEVSSVLECTLLQINVTKIVAAVAEGIKQYQPLICEKLLYSLLRQLDYGGIDLYKVTLNCIAKVVQPTCSSKGLLMILKYVQQIASLLSDPVQKEICSSSSTLGITHETWPDIEEALAQCLDCLAGTYSESSLNSHQFLRTVCHVLQQNCFHKPRLLDYLLSSLTAPLSKYSSSENTKLCHFTDELWIQFLDKSQAATKPLVLIIHNELSVSDSDQMICDGFEPFAKRPKLDFAASLSISQTLWDKLKNRWKKMINDSSERNVELGALFRIVIVGLKTKTRSRELGGLFDENELQQFNSLILTLLQNGGSCDLFKLICEYLNSCIPLTYIGFDKNIGSDWFNLSALPWLVTVSHDLDPKWTRISRALSVLFTTDDWHLKWAEIFVKFPTSFYRQWAIDAESEILKRESADGQTERWITRLVPWIVRHGKVFRDLLSDFMTRILASGSSELSAELIRNGSDIVCALSGRMSVVHPPNGSLSFRCCHSPETNSAAKLTSPISEDIGLFFLEFVFDENDCCVRWRVDLLNALLCHIQPHSESLRSSIRKKLRNLTSKAITDNRPVLQRTVLKCCVVLVQFWKEMIAADCLHALFQLILSAYSPLMVCWTSNALKEIATCLKIPPDVLFSRNTVIVCDILLSNKDIEWRTNFLSLAPEMFHLTSTVQCLNLLLPVLLPRLVLEFPSGPNPFFDEICSILRKSPSEILGKFFSCIYTHLLLHCDHDVQNAVIGHIEAVTKLNLVELRAPNFQTVYNDLLSQFHSNGDRILEAFATFAAEDKSVPKNRKGSDYLGDYLRPRFLGFLVHLDSKLSSKSVSDPVKIEALSSLPGIFRLMGTSNVTAVRLKILATLRTGLQLNYDPFHALNAAAWEAFVRHIDLKELGPLISQITVSVLTLHPYCADTIRSILYCIVVENGEELKDYLKEIHFLPELSGLEDIVYSLKKVCLSSDATVAQQVSLLTSNVCHEDYYVRLRALSHLKQIAQLNANEIQNMVIGTDEKADAVMTRLISALLRGCSVREEDMLLLYGQCFGYLGAVDPGRLNFNDEHHRDSTEYSVALIDDEFLYNLLNILARSFLAPRNAQTLDCCSFTIQEILKIYRGDDDSARLTRSTLWNRFPPHIRVAFTPLLTSRYVLKQQDPAQVPFPVYRSASGKNYASWLTNWTAYLIEKIGLKLAKNVFKSCLPTLRRDIHVNLFLLPYVVITALWNGTSENRHQIREEIMAVLMDRGLQRSPKRMMKRFSSTASTVDASSSQDLQKDLAASDLHQSCMQAIFYLLDQMKKWLKKKLSIHRSKKERTAAAQDLEFKVVQELVDNIPNDLLAKASYQCQAYARAVLHLEAHLKDNPSQLADQLGFLQKLYVSLDEPDGVAGVCAIRTQEPSLEENITAYEATGQLQDAFSCYERISQRDDCSVELYQGMLRCLLNLDLPQGALTMANGLLQNCPDWRRNLDDYRAECCWRLGQWDTLEDVVKSYATSSTNNFGWGVGLGQALLAAKSNDLLRMESSLRSVRLDQMRVISAVNLERNSYSRAYENFVKLHILSELESAVALLEVAPKEDVFQSRLVELLRNWDARLQGVQASVRFMEPILNMRRVVLKLLESQCEIQQPSLVPIIESEIGKSWLVSAKLARKASHFQRAHILQLVASTSPSPPRAIYMEQAKLHWAKGEHDQAITVLKRGIEKRFPDQAALKARSTTEPGPIHADVLECLKAKLLLARYYDQTGNADMASIIVYYKEVVEINRHWEEGWFFLAQYYDRLWNSLEVKDNHGDVARYIINNLGKSMQYGSHYIYQAMPRMLSLWMELGTLEMEASGRKTQNRDARAKLAEINKTIANFVDVVPPYKFLTAFPQLISRICHPHPEIASMLRQIIAKILIAYPQQCMWMIISVMKSSYNVRAKRCKEIIDAATAIEPNLRSFFSDATNLADRLVELANKPVENGVMNLSVSKSFKLLPKLLSGPTFSKIMVPLQWAMSVTLPTTPGQHVSHNPFPKDPVYIVGVDDTVEVMQSLQKPKKIALRGSDGRSYVFLCKPKDDLRKDFRLMEFNQLISRYLVRDPESRKRNLHIRTYAVIPLNEECGLIEWIPNLIGLRHILNRIYKDKGILTSNQDLRRLMPQLRDTAQKKRDVFLKELIPRFPPVLSEWFLSTFPDPQDWFQARLNYVRTIAVMSMVGFVVGLGDRHGENILFDAVCGDAVHVDFSCLFNKGETFEWPEKVPFRLTHNMVDAMGPTEIEGTYRKCCEVTLRVLRQQADTLLSVLKPFVHDPLVEWSKQAAKGRTDLGEIKNEQALEHVGNIERRLQGFLHSKSKTKIINLPLSVEGQVNQLITEARDVDNLAQMYIGWAAYM